MSAKNKLKSELIMEVAQLLQRIKELESNGPEAPCPETESIWCELIENSPDHIIALEPDLTIQYINRPSPGLSKDDLIGKSIISFLDDEQLENVESILQGVISTGKPAAYETEFQIPGEDGGIIYYETQAIPRRSAGKVIGLTLYSRDVSNRKQAEEALKESERQKTVLMDNLPGLAYRCINDQDYTMKIVSAGCLNLTGYGPDELVENAKVSYADIIHPKDLDQVRSTVQDALIKKESFELIYRIMTSQGDEKWVWEQGQGVFDELDEVVALEGFIIDITELKQAELELAHSHDLMNYIIEYSRSAIAVHDKDLNYIYVSKHYLEEYKVEDQDIIGKNYYEVFPDLPQKWRDVHQKALAGEILSAEDDPYPRDDGNLDWTRWECRPWHEADGTIGGIIVYTEVITERIQEEQEKDQLLRELKEANDRLTSLSRELINSQEAERKRISQELHDEFGQALTAISLDLGIIERELSPECPLEIKMRVADTKLMADELDQMIGELALDLRPSLLDDLGLLPTLNWYAERFSKRAEIEVEIELIGKEKRLPSEIETALYRITQEALTNVAKHASAGKVILRLEWHPKTIAIRIEDDGKGFDIIELQNANIPFQGLGLIGMGDRSALLGGRLDIQSNPGKGTAIEVEIPLTESEWK